MTGSFILQVLMIQVVNLFPEHSYDLLLLIDFSLFSINPVLVIIYGTIHSVCAEHLLINAHPLMIQIS